MIETGHV